MNLLLKLNNRKRKKQNTLKRVAAVFLALLIGVTSWLSVDVRAREALWGWIRKVTATHAEYTNPFAYGDLSSPQYRLSWVPDGFEFVEETVSDGGYSVFYLDQRTGDVVIFEFFGQNAGTVLHIFDLEEENLIHEKTRVGSTEADFYSVENKNDKSLVWHDNKTDVLFHICSNLSQEVMVKIAESIILVK